MFAAPAPPPLRVQAVPHVPRRVSVCVGPNTPPPPPSPSGVRVVHHAPPPPRGPARGRRKQPPPALPPGPVEAPVLVGRPTLHPPARLGMRSPPPPPPRASAEGGEEHLPVPSARPDPQTPRAPHPLRSHVPPLKGGAHIPQRCGPGLVCIAGAQAEPSVDVPPPPKSHCIAPTQRHITSKRRGGEGVGGGGGRMHERPMTHRQPLVPELYLPPPLCNAHPQCQARRGGGGVHYTAVAVPITSKKKFFGASSAQCFLCFLGQVTFPPIGGGGRGGGR